VSEPVTTRLLPGDRLPDVWLRQADGMRVGLHAEFAGSPLWLAHPGSARSAQALPAVADGVTALCVGPEIFDVPSAWRAFSADPRWRALLGEDVLWEADTNLRLQVGHSVPLSSTLPTPLAPRPLTTRETATLAPVLQIPDVFEPEFCAELIRHLQLDCDGGEPSGVVVFEQGRATLQIDPGIKQRRESPPRDPALETRMHERLMRRALPEVARVFNFPVSRRDPFKLLAYAEGSGYFRAHRDNETADVAHRRFALSVNLNAADYVGGEFCFPEFGPHRFAPATGGALVFSCSLLHEVLPVERGTRYAVTTFLA
jgi:predicted 2-oxoglutarate/Fe(II)-dependent dioxygenase YbiX